MIRANYLQHPLCPIKKQSLLKLRKLVFNSISGDTSPFSAVLKKNIFFADNFFVLIDFKEGYSIPTIISAARTWVSKNIGFFKSLFGSGLNIVIFLKGELSYNDIEGQCDVFSRPTTNLLTITIINVLDQKIEQERT